MQTLLAIAFLAFIAGLGFAPAEDLGKKVKTAAQISCLATVIAVIGRLLFVRVIS